ncbi:MAG TPA: hypothetical protein DDW31_01630 [candidate division Zixibacteria bacterium]|nr:hypothetical protein [candidate division Zixibacteria bacterium]
MTRRRDGQPFKFATSSSLVTVCGPRAGNAAELLEGVRTVSGSSIYHHSHQVYREWQAFGRPPVHDFGYWASEVLRERSLGEKLSMTDPTQYQDIRSFREALAGAMEEYLAARPLLNRCPPGGEFVFCESTSVIVDTGVVARDLGEFISAMGRVTNRSLYYHLFEARLRLKRPDNDFSIWLGEQMGEKEAAEEITRLDISVYTLEQIRARLLFILGQRQGLTPLALVRTLVQLPTDIVETIVTEVVNLPARTLNRLWERSPRELAQALGAEIKRWKGGNRQHGAG